MKLYNLKIQAFGPFSGKEHIDFSDLGDNPLFLIDGPTGAGKSSILHAICYALYGETTDAERKDQGLRCDRADADLLTQLSLEFSVHNKVYRITRTPTQMRPMKRGEGTTEHQSTAHLRSVNSQGKEKTLVAKKKKQADDKINEILGLSAAQFRQVMVIPQGKFRDLLLAKSDQRQAILSTLFQTQIFRRIESILKQQALDIETKYKDFELRIIEVLKDVNMVDMEGLELEIKESVEELSLQHAKKEDGSKLKFEADSNLKLAQELIKIFDEKKQIDDDLKKLIKKTDQNIHLKQQIIKAELATKLHPQWQLLQTKKIDLSHKNKQIIQIETDNKNIKKQLDVAADKFQQAESQYLQRDSLKSREEKLISYQQQMTTFQRFKNKLQQSQLEYQKIIKQQQKLDVQNKLLMQTFSDYELKIEQCEKLIIEKPDLIKFGIIAQSNIEKAEIFEQVKTGLSKLLVQNNQLKDQLEQANNSYQQAENNANQLEMQWFNNQAAILAQKLGKEDSCPVCGSIEHPQLAHFDQSIDKSKLNQDTIEQLRLVESKALKAKNKTDKALSNSQLQANEKQKALKKLESDLGGITTQSLEQLSKIHQDISHQLSLVEENEQALKNYKIDKSKVSKKMAQLKLEVDSSVSHLSQAIENKSIAKTNYEQLEALLPERYRINKSSGNIENLITSDINECKDSILSLETNLKNSLQQKQQLQHQFSETESKLKANLKFLSELEQQTDQQLKDWKNTLAHSDFDTQEQFQQSQMTKEWLEKNKIEVKNYEDNLIKTKAHIDVVEKQLRGKLYPDIDKLQQQRDQLKQDYNVIENLWNEADKYKSTLKHAHDRIIKLKKDREKVKQEYKTIGHLSKAASGRGNIRVSLERFVLADLLDSVLTIASQRLYVMSKGQYRLIRQDEENMKRNTTAGLDLAIDDSYTGKVRPVVTLSGGEAFLASLSLALALSDVVQQRSGGIQMDTLFIDEGFGSLDQESLQLAINTLVDLQATGRAIGIISHVSELKEQMSLRIDVSRSRTGSHIHIVN